MKNLIVTTILILAASPASAIGFSPWSETAPTPDPTQTQRVYVEAAGFAPWRDRSVEPDRIEAGGARDIAVTPGELNVFRPWS